jgi:hypothetical protein
MASINALIASFIEENKDTHVTDIPEFVRALKALVVDCIDVQSPPTSVVRKVGTSATASKQKVEKLLFAAEAESEAELNSTACTVALLADYCRVNGLRIGGSKADCAGRVWRHLTGETVAEDISPRSLPKKTPAKKEKHQCFGCTTKGQPCGLPGTQQFEEEWFCFKHIDTAEDFLIAANAPEPPPKVVSPKASPVKATATVSKRPGAGIKKAVVVDQADGLSDSDSN